jgi:Protein of unknown function (DUF2786)
MDGERVKLVDRITKLLALAESTEHTAEAETARNMAARLMAAHNIAAVKLKQDNPEPFVTDYRDWETSNFAEFCLHMEIAKLNGVFTIRWMAAKQYLFIGKPSDIEAFDYMLEIVLRQRTEAWLAYKASGGADSLRAFKAGFSLGVSNKIEQIIAASANVQRGWGLVPVSPVDAAEAWYLEDNKVRRGRSSAAQSSEAGRQARTSALIVASRSNQAPHSDR